MKLKRNKIKMKVINICGKEVIHTINIVNKNLSTCE